MYSKSLNDSNNFGGIALSSTLGKMLGLIILKDNHNALSSSDMQFGFKPDSSTTQYTCTFALSECINYYNSRDTAVQLVFLDATKAFDRVEYTKLFKPLLTKGLCPVMSHWPSRIGLC